MTLTNDSEKLLHIHLCLLEDRTSHWWHWVASVYVLFRLLVDKAHWVDTVGLLGWWSCKGYSPLTQGSLCMFIQVSQEREHYESVELYSNNGLEKAICWWHWGSRYIFCSGLQGNRVNWIDTFGLEDGFVKGIHHWHRKASANPLFRSLGRQRSSIWYHSLRWSCKGCIVKQWSLWTFVRAFRETEPINLIA